MPEQPEPDFGQTVQPTRLKSPPSRHVSEDRPVTSPLSSNTTADWVTASPISSFETMSGSPLSSSTSSAERVRAKISTLYPPFDNPGSPPPVRPPRRADLELKRLGVLDAPAPLPISPQPFPINTSPPPNKNGDNQTSPHKDEDDATTSAATEGVGLNSEHRIIFINGPQTNKFCNNHITTAKYSTLSFVPCFLFEQFRRYSNCFFLLIALLQQIPDVSPTGRWTTLTPLVFILSVSAIKEIAEDWKRHRADDEINHREVEVLRERHWQRIQWRHLQVGDICKVQKDDFFPADLLLLSSSEPQAISFIETSNLDGETNLKIRQAHPETARLLETGDLSEFYATIECEQPNRHLYEFTGNIRERANKILPLGPDQMLLRGAMLRNTSWVFGVVVYTGHDSKLMRNSTKAPLKRSTVDRLTNTQILMLFFILIVLCICSAVLNELWTRSRESMDWYIGLGLNKNFGFNLLTFIILYNNLIPISLQVTAEIVRFFQAVFISMDGEMYHVDSNTPAMARTSNLNEELGMVKYIFSDKTGTLTRNIMVFKRCSIAEILYNPPPNVEELEQCSLYQNLQQNHPTASVIREFLVLLAVCHTVIPEKDENGDIHYHAASPDERALVYGAAKFGFVFDTRTPHFVEVVIMGEREKYEILNVLEFTSTRKRMSVIVRTPTGEIKLFSKGADTVIYERLSTHGQKYGEVTLNHLEHFATEGLRTLCCAVGDVPLQFYEEWKHTYHKARTSMNYREQKIEEAAKLIENNLRLLGATAIEDKLQDGVPETIAALIKADINVWILTGDKQETAINIGYSARLIVQGMPLLILNEDSLDSTRDTILRHNSDLGENLKKPNDIALIIDGKTLKYALSCDLRTEFLDLCISCKVAICCRVSPIQKAEVVELVSQHTNSVSLAIGDGANDVAMIQRAAVGVGISGVEGLQAVCASDYSIAQFRFLQRLLLVHGAWNYSRMCKLILYSFYKNICLYVIELWFAIYSGWSGQILFERWTIGLYNVAFTAMPPFAMGIFDKVCSADTMLKHPELYSPSQRGVLFNVKVFWVWVINALIHSVFLFWLPMYATQHHVVWGNGRDGGFLIMGNFVYTYVVMTVCLKAGLITNSWTWLTHVAIWGSLAMWILFIAIYSHFWPIFGLGAVMLGMDVMTFSSPVFWLGLILIPLAIIIPDVAIKVIYNTAFKSVTEMVRETEIRKVDPEEVLSNQQRHSSSWLSRWTPSGMLRRWRGRSAVGPEPQPQSYACFGTSLSLLTETARLLKNVRSVFSRRSHTRVNMEVEMSHGFAFSQEEGGSVTQTDVIRAYDTNIPKPVGM